MLWLELLTDLEVDELVETDLEEDEFEDDVDDEVEEVDLLVDELVTVCVDELDDDCVLAVETLDKLLDLNEDEDHDSWAVDVEELLLDDSSASKLPRPSSRQPAARERRADKRTPRIRLSLPGSACHRWRCPSTYSGAIGPWGK